MQLIVVRTAIIQKFLVTTHSAYSGNLNFVLPSSHGTNGQFMKTDGSGNLSFAEAGGGDLIFTNATAISTSTKYKYYIYNDFLDTAITDIFILVHLLEL